MTYCAQCGYALRDGMLICPSCGVNTGFTAETQPPVDDESAPVTDQTPDSQPVLQEQPPIIPIPEPQQQTQSSDIKTAYGDNLLPTGKYALLTTGGYFLNQILFMIPVIGFFVSAIMCMASKKVNRRRHAASALIIHIILFILCCAATAGAIYLSVAVADYIKELFNSIFA